MINRVGVLICLVSALPAQAFGAAVNAPGVVSRVMIYRSQADVMRTVEVNLPEGGSDVRIPIPPFAQERTLRARADLESRIAGFRVETHEPRADDSGVVALEADVRDIEAEIEQQEMVIDAAEAALAYVKNIRPNAADGSSPADVGGIEKAAELIRAQVIENHEAIQRANEKVRSLTGALELMRAKLDEVRGRGGPARFAVIDVRRLTPGLARLVVEYSVPHAGWTPAYDARLSVADGDLRLSFYAEVWQRSGESWDEIHLLAAAGNPHAGPRMPELEPAYVEPPTFGEIVERARGGPAPAEHKMSFIVLDPDTSQIRPRFPALAADDGVRATYEVKQIGRLPSDGMPHRALIAEARLPVRFSHRAVPSLSGHVYLWAEAGNTLGFPLPAGPAQIFVDGAYAGIAQMAAVPAGETIGLSAGVDDRVTIMREKVKELWDTRRGRRSSLTRAWKVDVQNHRVKPVRVTVFDRVPVPTHDDIKIKLDLATRGYSLDDRGAITWTLELPPAQQKTVRFEYTASVPGDWTDILNRIE